jgi:putative oxidoreductase
MASAGIPVVPVSLALAIVLELGGGLAILLGYRVQPVALLMFFYLLAVTLSFHHFWTYQGAARQGQMINFLKNFAILGGLVQLASQGAGALSLDAKRLRA